MSLHQTNFPERDEFPVNFLHKEREQEVEFRIKYCKHEKLCVFDYILVHYQLKRNIYETLIMNTCVMHAVNRYIPYLVCTCQADYNACFESMKLYASQTTL